MHDESTLFFGKQVKALRNANRLTQEKLAALCEISTRTLSEIENGGGNPSYTIIASLVRIFRVSADVFFLPDYDRQDMHLKELLANYLACPECQKEVLFEFIRLSAQMAIGKNTKRKERNA